MNLEAKALWCDLGIMPYQEAYALQTQLALMRKEDKMPDIILQVQHPYEINFGSAIQHNQFSEKFIREIKKSYGDSFSREDIINHLTKEGIKFSETSRGGGATVVGPGQYVFYPIVFHPRITGKLLGVGEYKMAVDKVMFDALKEFGVPNIEIASGMKSGRERRDVWFIDGDRSYKIGSKGIKISENIAYHGFVLYMDNEGLKHFDKVNACGYGPNEVGITSAEQVLGRKINSEVIISSVRKNLSKQFNYDEIKDISKQELYKLVEVLEVPQNA